VQLHTVQIKRIIGPTPNGAAVLLGNDQKTFVIFVGFYEAAALIREINHETPARPLTHELIQNICLGFDIYVKQIIVSEILDSTFCATLVLEQRVAPDSEGGEWNGRRNEVRIDARPSDCLVLALKNRVDILVTDEVFQSVKDVSETAQEVEDNLGGLMPNADFGEFSPPESFPEARAGSPDDEPGGFLDEFGMDEDDEMDFEDYGGGFKQ